MSYKPKQGDIVWIDFGHNSENNIKTRRSVLVVWSNDVLDMMADKAQVCPITDTDDGFPLHVKISTKDNSEFIMCEQTRVIDLKQRHCEYKDHVNDEVLQMVINNLRILLD